MLVPYVGDKFWGSQNEPFKLKPDVVDIKADGLGASERSNWVKVNGLKVKNWTELDQK